MAKFSTLSPEQRNLRNIWLGIMLSVCKNQQTSPVMQYGSAYTNNKDWNQARGNLSIIYNFILNRPMSDYRYFTQIDNILRNLDGSYYIYSQDGSKARATLGRMASYIADFIAEKQFYFSDFNLTTDERALINTTIIGAALEKFGCFASQRNNIVSAKPSSNISKAAAAGPAASQAPAASATNPAASTATQNSANIASTLPKNQYKSLGGLSKNATILTTGIKENLFQKGIKDIFCINAPKVGANVPNAFVTPVTNSGKSIDPQKASLVNFGSGQGYPDCKLYFLTDNEAAKFLVKVKQKFDQLYQGIFIAVAHPKADDYFYEVNTEFGPAWIKASKLNEELVEALIGQLANQDCDECNKFCAGRDLLGKEEIHNFDVYEEAFLHEYN